MKEQVTDVCVSTRTCDSECGSVVEECVVSVLCVHVNVVPAGYPAKMMATRSLPQRCECSGKGCGAVTSDLNNRGPGALPGEA